MLFFGSDFGLKFSTTMGVLVTAISSFACVDIDARQFSRHDLDLSQAEEPVPDSVARCRASCQEFNDKFRAKCWLRSRNCHQLNCLDGTGAR
jgi:hypothetical protein